MKFLILALALFTSVARAETDIGQEVRQQFDRMRAVVSKMKPEFAVGGYLNGKSFGDHEVLWHLEPAGDAEVIRIYRKKKNGQAFDITFHRNDAIVRGRTVIRRFVGPSPTGWRNDTVDADTGEYLGSQGQEEPLMDKRDREIFKRWLE